jgi:alpha-glucosidase (family GH31 glycosyl hydrolase)
MKLAPTYGEYIQNAQDLYMIIYILKNGIFRVKIKDSTSVDSQINSNPRQKRFHMKKIDETFNMKSMAKRKNFKIVNTTNDKMTIYYFSKSPKNKYFIDIDNTKKIKYELNINYSPFKLTYSLDNKLIIQINSRNLLNMEFPGADFTKTEDESMSSVKMDVSFHNSQFLYGLPERAADIQLTDTFNEDAYRLFNIDYFKYTRDTHLGLYGTIPFILACTGDVYSGFIWNNPSETYVGIQTSDSGKDSLFISESGVIDFSFFSDTNINNFYYKYHMYIGFTPLPPVFALGYHQSRWNYKDTQDLFQVDRKFDEYDIPYDSIWLDIEVNIYGI